MNKLQEYFAIINDAWKLLHKFAIMEKPEFGSDEYWAELVLEAGNMGTHYGTEFAKKQAELVISEMDRIWREERNERI